MKTKNIETRIAAIEEAIQLGRANETAYLAKVCVKYEIGQATLCRWMAKVKSVPRPDWPDALRPSYKPRQPTAIQPEAWEYFLDRYRQSRSLSTAHKAYAERARSEGWQVLSEMTLKRRLAREGLRLPRRRSFSEFDI